MTRALNSDSFYNRFTGLYPLVDIFLKPQKKVLFEEVDQVPAGKLLEIGVGNGSHFELYRKHEITGIDTSAMMLKVASKKNKGLVQLHRMSGEALEFDDNVFDYVVLSHVVAVVNDAEKMLEEVFRVLKPEGKVFVLNHFTPDNWLKWIDRSFEPLSGMLRFRSHFRMDDIAAIKKFTPVKEIRLGVASYFKILIYTKS